MDRDLVDFFSSDKEFAQTPVWIPRDDHYFMIASSSLDIDGVTIEGLELRGNAKIALRDEAVSVQLQYTPPSGKAEHICRVCWKPLHRHNNKGLGPPELRNQWVTVTHCHVFDRQRST